MGVFKYLPTVFWGLWGACFAYRGYENGQKLEVIEEKISEIANLEGMTQDAFKREQLREAKTDMEGNISKINFSQYIDYGMAGLNGFLAISSFRKRRKQ